MHYRLMKSQRPMVFKSACNVIDDVKSAKDERYLSLHGVISKVTCEQCLALYELDRAKHEVK